MQRMMTLQGLETFIRKNIKLKVLLQKLHFTLKRKYIFIIINVGVVVESSGMFVALYFPPVWMFNMFPLSDSEGVKVHVRNGLTHIQWVTKYVPDLWGKQPRLGVGAEVEVEMDIFQETFRSTENRKSFNHGW